MPNSIEISANDGVSLSVRHFPTSDSSAPALVIVHGACEHGGRYLHVAEEFNRRGWNVIVPDLRGHGRSAGCRVHVRHFDEYVSDLKTILAHFACVPTATVMLGHSMGGLVATRFVQAYPADIRALILMSPLLRVGFRVAPFTLALGKLLSYILPRYRFANQISPENVTRNQEVLEARAKDSLMVNSVTAGWFFAMKQAIRDAWQDRADVNLPLLVIQAEEDRVVDPLAAGAWLENVPSGEKRLIMKPESFHEVLNEQDWLETVDVIYEWIVRVMEIEPKPTVH
ncbi:MAG: alpha/beta hydrolase [Planctomycetaceae bacterium]